MAMQRNRKRGTGGVERGIRGICRSRSVQNRHYVLYKEIMSSSTIPAERLCPTGGTTDFWSQSCNTHRVNPKISHSTGDPVPPPPPSLFRRLCHGVKMKLIIIPGNGKIIRSRNYANDIRLSAVCTLKQTVQTLPTHICTFVLHSFYTHSPLVPVSGRFSRCQFLPCFGNTRRLHHRLTAIFVAHVGHSPQCGQVCGQAQSGEDGRQSAQVAAVHDVCLAAVRVGAGV